MNSTPSNPVAPCQPSTAHTPTPWAYRPVKFDDWGYIRGPKEPGDFHGPIVAIARGDSNQSHDEHRAAGTDPYGPNALFIVEAVNSHATLKARVEELEAALAKSNDALADWLAFAEEELGEFDLEECEFGEASEALCHKCQSAGCINLKIRNTRAALSQAKPAGETGA